MRIAILGRGSVGTALGGRWTSAGHDVVYGVRRPDGPDEALVPEVCRDADVVVVALPAEAVAPALGAVDDLAGRLVIDCSNPLEMGPDGLRRRDGPSPARGIQDRFPEASVFKAFASTGAEVMAAPLFGDRRAAMPFCGDDDARRPLVRGLVTDVGFEPLDVGSLSQAPLLEHTAVLWIALARREFGRTAGFGVLRRDHSQETP